MAKYSKEELKRRIAEKKAALDANTTTPEPEVVFPVIDPNSVVDGTANTEGKTFKELTGIDHGGDVRFTKLEGQPDVPPIDPDHVIDPDTMFASFMAVELNIPALFVGPPGSGKTVGIKQTCAYLGRSYMRINGMRGLEPSDLVGSLSIRDGNMEYNLGRAGRAVRDGYVLAYDEPFKCDPAVNMCFQWLLESDNPAILLYGHPDEDKQMLPAHPNFRMFLCDNVRGTGDDLDKYAATDVQDSSLLSRVRMRISQDYMRPELEHAMLIKKFPFISNSLAKEVTTLAILIRNAWDKGSLEMTFSPREYFSWFEIAQFMGAGNSAVLSAFKMVYYGILTDSEKGAVAGFWHDCGLEHSVGRLV